MLPLQLEYPVIVFPILIALTFNSNELLNMELGTETGTLFFAFQEMTFKLGGGSCGTCYAKDTCHKCMRSDFKLAELPQQ